MDRRKNITVRLSVDEKIELEIAAKKADRSMESFVRQAIKEKIEKEEK